MKVKARHILVQNVKKTKKLKQEIESGGDFAELAKLHSNCPSGQSRGLLGEFSPGEMVLAFDKVVFKEKLNAIHSILNSNLNCRKINLYFE